MMSRVAVLFARSDSIYKGMPDCDVYDKERDARRYHGKLPVIAHPPCRAWGRLRQFARPAPGEKELAFLAVNEIRRCGGVLEHPESSVLWNEANLPSPIGGEDEFGGWSLAAPQFWWGHKAQKKTWLYIVGCRRKAIPTMPLVLGEAAYVVSTTRGIRKKPEISKADREKTPPLFAQWLFELALRCTRIK